MSNINITPGQKAKIQLDAIKQEYNFCGLSYQNAKDMAKEHLRILNEEMEKISRKFGRKHKTVDFTSYMR